MSKYFIITFLFLTLFSSVFCQTKNTDLAKKDKPKEYYLNTVSNYFKKYPPKENADSVFYNSFEFLLEFENDYKKKTFLDIDKLIVNNKLQENINQLYPYRNILDSLNKVRQGFLADYWKNKQLKTMADTGDIASTDSLFLDILEEVMHHKTINIDSILNIYGRYNDTILDAVNKSITIFKNNWYVKRVAQMRNDTVNFYIVDLEGDSVLLRLYNNNQKIVRMNLTDYWGKEVKAIARNIHKNSFRLLIDNAPFVAVKNDEKARQEMEKLDRSGIKQTKLTIKKRDYNPPIERWLLGGNMNIDMSQTGLHQWAKGGESTINISAGVNLFANYKGDKYKWDNSASFRYGVIRQGNYFADSIRFRSNDDKIEIKSMYVKIINKKFSAGASGTFISQFSPVYEHNDNKKTNNKLSEFMSPGIINLAVGAGYTDKNKNLKLFLSPLTIKSTWVLINNASVKTSFGLDTTKRAKHEMGASFEGYYKLKFLENLEMINQLTLFSNYIYKPMNIDIDWEFTFIFPVNDYIRASIYSNIIYDHDIKVPKKGKKAGPGIQIREKMAIGFIVKF